jgi:hypothetical protein
VVAFMHAGIALQPASWAHAPHALVHWPRQVLSVRLQLLRHWLLVQPLRQVCSC